MNENLCRQCIAELLLDESLCKKDEKNCFERIAGYKGDPDICNSLSDTRDRDDCRKWTSSKNDFLPSTSLWKLDSDGDGLLNIQEKVFNTSIANADTDGDGVNDYEETMVNMTNPLGEGKLGDHIVRD